VRTLIFPVLLSAGLLAAPGASAQADAAPAADDGESGELDDEARKALAREHYDAGKTHYTVGEFEQALERFAAAYKLRPAPLLLFNMGQSARQLGRHGPAVFFFEGFLREAAPDDANRPLVEELLEEEKGEVAAAELEIVPEAKPTPTAPAVETPVESETEPRPIESVADAAVDTAEEPAPITEQWWFWTGVAGAAVVATAAAVGTGIAVVALQPPAGPAEGSLGVVDLR
jgi:tetratricopeptide (TPR) repeat protein